MTLLERMAAEKQAAFDIGLRIGRQQSIDLLQLALQSKQGFGEKRMWELLTEMRRLYDEIAPAFDVEHPECDWYREQLDKALTQSCGKEHPLIPFAERYEDLKQVSYGRKKR
jgi:hypothetical protein